jgi:hypothetical protein
MTLTAADTVTFRIARLDWEELTRQLRENVPTPHESSASRVLRLC